MERKKIKLSKDTLKQFQKVDSLEKVIGGDIPHLLCGTDCSVKQDNTCFGNCPKPLEHVTLCRPLPL